MDERINEVKKLSDEANKNIEKLKTETETSKNELNEKISQVESLLGSANEKIYQLETNYDTSKNSIDDKIKQIEQNYNNIKQEYSKIQQTVKDSLVNFSKEVETILNNGIEKANIENANIENAKLLTEFKPKMDKVMESMKMLDKKFQEISLLNNKIDKMKLSQEEMRNFYDILSTHIRNQNQYIGKDSNDYNRLNKIIQRFNSFKTLNDIEINNQLYFEDISELIKELELELDTNNAHEKLNEITTIINGIELNKIKEDIKNKCDEKKSENEYFGNIKENIR